MNIPRPIGYWYYEHGGQEILPHPGDLVYPGWVSADEKEKLVAYLKGGATYETWRGLSDCRFKCGIDDREMGCRDFTDGIWVWPEGLYHYIGEHDVMLPQEFVAHCHAQTWMIPPYPMRRIELSHKLDYTLWIAWAREVRTSAEPYQARVVNRQKACGTE